MSAEQTMIAALDFEHRRHTLAVALAAGKVRGIVLSDTQNPSLELIERVAMLHSIVKADPEGWEAITALAAASPRFGCIADAINQAVHAATTTQEEP